MDATVNIAKKRKKKLPGGQIALHTFFCILSLAYIIPLILLVATSFEGAESPMFSLMPREFSLRAYEMIFESPTRIINAYKVTAFYSIFGTLASLAVMSMFAYTLARPNFKLKNVLTFILFFTTLFSGGMVPSYILNTRYLGIGNTIWIYILPAMVSAWDVIVIRTYFKGLPNELYEAAYLDGASELRLCFTIILPLSTPVLASVGFLSFIGRWNNWYTTQIYIKDLTLYSLQYLLKIILDNMEWLEQLANEGQMDAKEELANLESMRFAMAVVAAGPMLVVFPFFQKYFAKGMTLGAVKG